MCSDAHSITLNIALKIFSACVCVHAGGTCACDSI